MSAKLELYVDRDPTLFFKSDDVIFDGSSADIPDYGTDESDYIVRPLFTDQLLMTKGKRMLDNLKVESVPYNETSNESGGRTVSIMS